MKDFTSICRQLITSTTCTGPLNAATYVNPFCLVQVNRIHYY